MDTLLWGFRVRLILAEVAVNANRELPFEHVHAKVLVPAPRPGSISRTAVINRLRASQSHSLVTLVAPAGSGKTTILAQWADRDDRPFAWVSIDDRDNDPVALLRDVAAAIDRVTPLDRAVLTALRTRSGSVWTAAVPRLAAAIATSKAPLVLVLDDASRLTSQASAEILRVLAEHIPSHSTLALSGRSPLGLPIASIRAQGRLFEVGPDLIALSRREADALLRASGIELREDQVSDLLDRTEGWAAGLYLAALAIRDGGDAGFSGDDRYLADYFRSECLADLDEDERSFLMRTSILDTMNGALCDAVLERSGSARKLEAFDAANLFVVPLDRSRDSYRYHHLFRDLLVSELERHEPDRVRALRALAADWYEANGEPEAAIAQAAATGDLDRAARLVAALAVPTCDAGRIGVVEGWLPLFAGPQLERYPAVALLGAWVHGRRGRTSQARHWLAAAERGPLDWPLPDGSTSLRPWLALLHSAMCNDGAEQMLRDARAGLAELPIESCWRPTALLLEGTALALLGDTGPADEALALAVETGEPRGAIEACVAALSLRAVLAADRGDHVSGDLLAEEARHVGAGTECFAAAVLQIGVFARTLLRRGRFEEARHELALARRLAPSQPDAFPWLTLLSRLELAQAYVTLRDVGEAKAQLAEAAEILVHHPGLGVLSTRTVRLQEELDELRDTRSSGESGLTRAELRLLPLLASHLSFREIGERLSVTRNTVKSQAISVYRKLGATSRSEAIEQAGRLGLLDLEPAAPIALAS
jgi:LuxR family transcriptional regulator, maltose regulon positive regulatory protein